MKSLIYLASLIAIIEIIALSNGIDGTALSVSTATIGTIAGYVMKTLLMKRRK